MRRSVIALILLVSIHAWADPIGKVEADKIVQAVILPTGCETIVTNDPTPSGNEFCMSCSTVTDRREAEVLGRDVLSRMAAEMTKAGHNPRLDQNAVFVAVTHPVIGIFHGVEPEWIGSVVYNYKLDTVMWVDHTQH